MAEDQRLSYLSWEDRSVERSEPVNRGRTARTGAGSRETGLVGISLWLEKPGLWVGTEPGHHLHGVMLLHRHLCWHACCWAKVCGVVFEQGNKTSPAVPPRASLALQPQPFGAPSGWASALQGWSKLLVGLLLNITWVYFWAKAC